jgi:hypothetical protein
LRIGIIAQKNNIHMRSKILLLTLALCLLNLFVDAQTGAKISPNDWMVYSENDERTVLKDTVYEGKTSIKLDGKKAAIAIKKGQRYKNFRIECDIAGRVMSGIGFRAKDHQNYHFLYFRPGYGGTQEAIQYIPVYNGTLSWVLYNYPTYEKTADLQSMQWFHVGLEVRENIMKVFVNNSKEALMEINLVESDFDEGDILLRTMFGESYFANIAIYEMSEALTDWEISEQYPRKDNLELSPTTPSTKWTKVKADAANIVNISRYIPNPNGVIIAKHALNADNVKDVILYFDFIGKLKIFLNGKELFYYEKHKLDRIFSGTERILLHLKKGTNELIFVSEGDSMIFGGGKGFNAMGRTQHQNWGFIAEVGKR